jgi:peptidoglycan/xylan/chitin deacetylase (PgdA/CDA1 family)
MIGVVADAADHDVVCEFFELFKTPWEFFRSDHQYDVVLCAGEFRVESNAEITVQYSSSKLTSDNALAAEHPKNPQNPVLMSHQKDLIPIYGKHATFSGQEDSLLKVEDSGECLGYRRVSQYRTAARLGYDLFAEIRFLLTEGQPLANAGLPTLELHIQILRDMILSSGLTLLEVPPVPEGYRLITCLTHDVDHPSIRQHGWDHTTFGFLYRAIFVSLRKLLRGQMPITDVLANWIAVLRLPLVQFGWAKDFWRDFADRYLEIENGCPSTYFLIPFSHRPGNTIMGKAPALRGATYGAEDLAGTIKRLQSANCEIGLHGIDAWLDTDRGREELDEIKRLTGNARIGVRMHWLYYGKQSAATVEASGADFDSTIGYNETVGFRAGTTQGYKPLDAQKLLELPLHAMDTAMFYPSYLGLSPDQATKRLRLLADNVVRFGGAFTINWHDRSVAPERLWTATYRDLIGDLRKRGAWFATTEQAVSWFRKRRMVRFEFDAANPGGVRTVLPPANTNKEVPGLKLRVHQPQRANLGETSRSPEYTDTALPLVEPASADCTV